VCKIPGSFHGIVLDFSCFPGLHKHLGIDSPVAILHGANKLNTVFDNDYDISRSMQCAAVISNTPVETNILKTSHNLVAILT